MTTPMMDNRMSIYSRTSSKFAGQLRRSSTGGGNTEKRDPSSLERVRDEEQRLWQQFAQALQEIGAPGSFEETISDCSIRSELQRLSGLESSLHRKLEYSQQSSEASFHSFLDDESSSWGLSNSMEQHDFIITGDCFPDYKECSSPLSASSHPVSTSDLGIVDKSRFCSASSPITAITDDSTDHGDFESHSGSSVSEYLHSPARHNTSQDDSYTQGTVTPQKQAIQLHDSESSPDQLVDCTLSIQFARTLELDAASSPAASSKMSTNAVANSLDEHGAAQIQHQQREGFADETGKGVDAYLNNSLNDSLHLLLRSFDSRSIISSIGSHSLSHSTDTSIDLVTIIDYLADLMYGNHVYYIQPWFTSDKVCIRSYQGTIATFLSFVLLFSQLCVRLLLPQNGWFYFWPVVVIPFAALCAWTEVHLPHSVDEVNIALCATIGSVCISNYAGL